MADEWKDYGSCREVGPDLFFSESRSASMDAITICADCPIRQKCLNYAIENHIDHGIWSGTTAYQRRKSAKAA